MPAGPALQVLVDTAQRRVKRSRNPLTVSGEEWDGPNFSNTWIFPEANVLMCRPVQLTPEWHTHAAIGDYARWGLSDFGLDAGDGWRTDGIKDGPGKVRLFNAKGMPASAILTSEHEANRAVFASYFAFNVGNDDSAVYFECGFSAAGNGDSGPSLRFWSGGKVEVWKDGVFLSTYTLGNKRGTQTANTFVDLLFIPMRGREVGVYSITSGDAFVHVFEDISPDDDSPIVTPEAPFWWYVPSKPGKTATVNVEVSAVNWLDGYATSIEAAFGKPPVTGDDLEEWENAAPFESIDNGRLFAWAFPQGGDVTSISFVQLDGATAFVPNGVLKDCRMRVELTGGTHTAFVNGAHMAYAAEVVETTEGDDGPFDLTPYIRSAEMSFGDSTGPSECTVVVGWPEELGSLVPLIRTVSNRPAKVSIGEIVIIDAVTLPAKFKDGEHDGVKELTIVFRDRMQTLREAVTRVRMPLDGMPLCKPAASDGKFNSAVEFWYRFVGLSEEQLDLDDVDFDLPRMATKNAKEFCHEAPVGAHPLDELDQLQQDYASTFLMGIRPTVTGPKALFKDPDGFSDVPDKILYRSDEDAIVVDADPDEDVYWTFAEEPLEIEANETVAVGWDPQLQRSISAYAEDLLSKDPALAPADRPDNWLGEERVMGVINKRLSRQEDCERAVTYIHPQVSARYFVVEWTSSMLFLSDGSPIWRGHLVRLDGHRDVRVSSMRVKFWREPGDVESEAVAFREATYTGGTLTNAGGIGLQAIKDAHARRAVNKTVKRPGYEIIEQATARTIVAV